MFDFASLLHHWCMHTTCFDQHWPSLGASKIVDETAVFNLETEAQQFHQQF
jgi:hypothetical protein